jgi:hypothetical protein
MPPSPWASQAKDCGARARQWANHASTSCRTTGVVLAPQPRVRVARPQRFGALRRTSQGVTWDQTALPVQALQPRGPGDTLLCCAGPLVRASPPPSGRRTGQHQLERATRPQRLVHSPPHALALAGPDRPGGHLGEGARPGPKTAATGFGGKQAQDVGAGSMRRQPAAQGHVPALVPAS